MDTTHLIPIIANRHAYGSAKWCFQVFLHNFLLLSFFSNSSRLKCAITSKKVIEIRKYFGGVVFSSSMVNDEQINSANKSTRDEHKSHHHTASITPLFNWNMLIGNAINSKNLEIKIAEIFLMYVAQYN